MAAASLRSLNVENGPQGFSNPKEVPKVVIQARAATRRYGAGADIRVITFYNMQKLALERAFKTHRNLKNIRIVSVRRSRWNCCTDKKVIYRHSSGLPFEIAAAMCGW